MINTNEILKLSVAERLLLLEKIWDSLNQELLEVPESHKEESLRRIQRIREGKMKMYTWDEIKNDLKDLR